MNQELWCHELAVLCHEVHPTAGVDIATVTFGKFITEYMTADGKKNRIIGRDSANGSDQFIFIPEVWVSSFPYVFNAVITQYIGWDT